jgi:hypothetical protein
MKKLTFKTL